MSDRINLMRKTLRSTLELLNTPGDWAILTEQRGPFAYIEFTGDLLKKERNRLYYSKKIYFLHIRRPNKVFNGHPSHLLGIIF